MGTPETTFSIATNREARNAIFIAIAMISIAFLSISILISPALEGQSVAGIVLIETAVIAGQIITAIFAIAQVSRGRIELGVWSLIYSFMAINIFRVLLHESIGLYLGVINAIVVSAASYLTLPVRKANRAIILGYAVGAAIVLFDLYITKFYFRLYTAPELVHASRNLAIFVFVIQLFAIATQSRSLSLGAKISNYFSLFALVAVIAVSFSGIQVVNNFIASGRDITGYTSLTLGVLRQGIITAGAIVAFLGAVLGVFTAETLTRQLNQLTEVSSRVSSGDLNARAALETEDEIGTLAGAFNNMADSLKGMVGQLEARVDERTKDLQRRAIQIQAAVDIGRAATSLRDLESLLTHTTQLISERFGYYHAGIFLLDQAGEFAVLHAANSEGGKKMLERGHKLKVGQTGIVGYVTQSGMARIALDVGQDAVFFDNPDLPETRSEMALPLSVSGQILGALDVQSIEPKAFAEEDIATLRIVADQLAIAIENARLIAEAQEALEATRIAYGEISREAWAKIIKSQPRISYVAASLGTIQVNSSAAGADMIKAIETGDVIISSDGLTVGVPIKIRGKAIGVLRLKKTDSASAWTHDETTLAISLSEQLSGALESARLYKESQQRAARESLVSDISAHIGAFPRIETIVHETVQELGQVIGNAKVSFSLVDPSEDIEQAQGSRGNGHEAE